MDQVVLCWPVYLRIKNLAAKLWTMYRILVAVDTDETRTMEQLDTLESLPQFETELEVHLLHVYEAVSAPADEAGPVPIDRINDTLDEIRELPESVEMIATSLESAGIDPTVHELVGDPAEAIPATAEEVAADCILMGVRDRTPLGKVILGSISQQVLLESEIPVLIAR